MNQLKKIVQSITFKLFIILIGALTIVFSLYTYLTVENQSKQMMEMVIDNANATTDLIRSSIHYSMQEHRKEDAYKIIKTIGKEPTVLDIRLYNKEGIITYSTNPEEIKTKVDIYVDACAICHDVTPPLYKLPYESRWRIFRTENHSRILELTTPIQNEASCYDVGCHPSPDDVTILGVLDVLILLDQVDENIYQARSTMLYAAVIVILVVSSIFAVLLLIMIRRPVGILNEGTNEIASGNLGYEIQYESDDELGKLALSFNKMSRELKEAHDEITEWSETLEEKVRVKTEALKKAQAQLIQIEKMASLGKLSASVAHEINNPLEGILTYSKLIKKRLEKQDNLSDTLKEMLEDIEIIIKETERTGNIVKNLLLFSRKQVGDFERTPVSKIINNATRLVQHHFKISGVELTINIPDDDIAIYCSANQIEQALVALFVNAAEAMPDGGTLTVSVESPAESNYVNIKVSDTGVGIPPEDIPHIFEPFFTRKQEEKGVGLGLSIVYGIIERHGGQIFVDSEPGKGTTFTIQIPTTSQKERRVQEENNIQS